MDNRYFPRKIRVYLPLVVLFALLLTMMPRTSRFPYDYRKGEQWRYETLTARFDFPIRKTEGQLTDDREAITAQKLECYVVNENVAFVSKGIVAQKDFHNDLKARLTSTLENLYNTGVASSALKTRGGKPVYIYIQSGKEVIKKPASEVYTEQMAMDAFLRCCPGVDVAGLFSREELLSLIQPNISYDEYSTEQIFRRELDAISTTDGFVRTGQRLVAKDAIITEEILQILDSYKAEYNETAAYSGNPVFMWIGNVTLSFVLVLLFFFVVYFSNYKIFGQYNKYIYTIVVFFLPTLLTSLVSRVGEANIYLIPYTLVALYLYAFFKPRLVFSVYLISLIPVMLIVPNGTEIFLMHLIAGTICMLVFEKFSKGWLQFVSALIAFFVMTIIWFAFRMIDGMDNLHDYTVIFNIAISSILLVAAYPLVYLFEKIFGLVSKSKLIDLTDTSNKLLRMLADKAPGTFQHSLQVMNLADAAARTIDADVPLIRAGALYHDIGKIANPHCFTENSTTDVSYHSELTPKESAQDIIKHVSDGVHLAEKHYIPGVIKDFIVTHHGTTKTGYFYTKFVNDGGDPSDVEPFTYDGRKPETKEQVILMLCDAVEAASRSLKGYSSENISALVDKIFQQKIDEDQLSESKISLRELGVIKEAIKSYLVQMYHSRVAYPKRRK